MRSVELLLVGLMLVGVALVPPGWQDERFQRLLPGTTRAFMRRPRPRRRSRSLTIPFVLAGLAFVVAAIRSLW